jgi:hypothetical protein
MSLSGVSGLDALITQLMTSTQVPGVAVGILDDDEEHFADFGVTSIQSAEYHAGHAVSSRLDHQDDDG